MFRVFLICDDAKQMENQLLYANGERMSDKSKSELLHLTDITSDIIWHPTLQCLHKNNNFFFICEQQNQTGHRHDANIRLATLF